MNILTKRSSVSLFLGGLMMAVGLYFAPATQAEELPDANLHNQLDTEINQQAANEVNQALQQHPVTAPQATEASNNGANQTQQANQPNQSPLIINTGGNATINDSSTQNSTTAVNNQNTANVGQTVNASANTGGNTANGNISFGGNAGNITTGNAVVYNELVAAANSNQTGVSGNCHGAPGGSSVVNTGTDLTYDGSDTANCVTTITNGNGAVINQVVNASANTGDNQANGNIAIGGGSAGVITTGDAAVGTLLVTRANENVVLVGGTNGNGGPGNGANIYLINTGSNASIDNRRLYNSLTTVNNSNAADILQSADIFANTGGNTSNGNINLNGDAGVIRTGDAIVDTELSVNTNTNQTVVNNNNGQTGAGGDTEIINTGENLNVDNSSEANTTTTVNNTNTAEVDQEVNVVANTGNNTANGNIAFNGDAGVIRTGDAIITTTAEVDVNDNKTLISGSQSGSGNGNQTEIINTGDDATIDVSTEENNTTTVNNTNTAEVDQEVNVVANTGNNTANGNIGNTSISTGDVIVNTEIITNANNNYTFIVDSNINGLELFKQFVTTFLGIDWDDLVSGAYAQNPNNSNTVSLVNTGDNANIVAENVQNREVIVNNTNNANVNQQVNVVANTGNNTCTANVGGCDIVTGTATIWTQLIANLNNNFTFIGNVQLPTPEEPEEPETPTKPEEPQVPEEEEEDDDKVLGENIKRDRPTAVLAATTLPMTGGENLALFGAVLVLAGLGLTVKKAKA